MAFKTKEEITASKKTLYKEAEKVIEKINKAGLRHDHIAKQIGVEKETLSRFMNLNESYITRSLLDRLTTFLNK